MCRRNFAPMVSATSTVPKPGGLVDAVVRWTSASSCLPSAMIRQCLPRSFAVVRAPYPLKSAASRSEMQLATQLKRSIGAAYDQQVLLGQVDWGMALTQTKSE